MATKMENPIFVFIVFLVGASAMPELREYRDSDNMHSYFRPAPDASPETWRDWTNPPGLNNQDWYQLGRDELDRAIKISNSRIEKRAKNVILFVGDGMGISTVSAARVYRSQANNIRGEDVYLSFERFPHAGLSMTYATDQIVPDSANTATALMCGVKCRDGVIGANQNVVRSDCSSLAGNEVDSVMRMAIEEHGMVGGIITSTRVTHATPASSYSHSADRNWEADGDMEEEDRVNCEDIASQLIREERNQNIRVILGGGRQKFMTVNDSDPEYPDRMGVRLDGNLIEEWESRRAASGLSDSAFSVVYDLEDFDAVDPKNTEYLLGLFEPDHMQYAADKDDRDVNPWPEPTMTEMVEKGINILEKYDEGYVLVVESGRIDQAHHDTKAFKALNETVAFQDAIARAMEITNEEETLMLVTADHSHVFTIAGYGVSNSDILSLDETVKPQMSGDDKPYLTLGYTNGPGFNYHRINSDTGEEQPRLNVSGMIPDKDYEYDAGIERYSETHGGEDVGIWARGPMAHLVQSTHEQSYFGHLQMYALCLDGHADGICSPNIGGATALSVPFSVLLTALIATLMAM